MSDIFIFGRPDIYFECIQLLIMIISLYLSLWFVHYCNAKITPGWKALTIIPGILSATNYFYIIKSASLLKVRLKTSFEKLLNYLYQAIDRIDEDAALEVIEQTEGSKSLAETIRRKLLSHLNLSGNSSKEEWYKLREMFDDIDIDKGGKLR